MVFKCSLSLCFYLFFCFCSQAQVGINTTSPNGILDVTSDSSGVLVPRVSLSSINLATPIFNSTGGIPENSTLVYNIATTTGTNGVSPGFYYWNINHWSQLITTDTPRKELLLNNNATFLNSAQQVNSTAGNSGNEIIATVNFILERPALVQISGTVGVTVSTTLGGVISDGRPRLYGAYFTINDSSVNAVRYGMQSGSYTNTSSSGTVANGYYFLSPSGFVQLSAGAHTITFRGISFGGNSTVRATFGGSGTEKLQIVAQY